jgi:Holliday junction DNA helicase RuvA
LPGGGRNETFSRPFGTLWTGGPVTGGGIEAAMIGYLEGKLLQIEEERILLLAGHVGYEVLLPATVMEDIRRRPPGDPVALYVYHHQTERQPKPVLIGFNREVEKEFFQHFISVADVGPLKAVKALSLPMGEIARAIEARDDRLLSRLKGIGKRTAHKIIAALAGKVSKFAHPGDFDNRAPQGQEDTIGQVMEVLVDQLGHRTADARRMIADALERQRDISTPEELIEEVYRGQAVGG